jgi:hypothetical protein
MTNHHHNPNQGILIAILVVVLIILTLGLLWTAVAGRQIVMFRQIWPRLSGLTQS